MKAEANDSFAATLLASASLGFVLGLLFPTPHVAIEPAQVLAGLVEYPTDNPFGIYERRLWSLWHQILAPLLAAGVPERALNFAVSGAAGALSFAAVAAFASACGAPLLHAVAAPLFLWILNPVGWGFNYPILLLGHPHTYGMAGLSFIVLATSVLGAGRFAAGAFLLGMAPAVHPSLGAWAALVTGLSLLADWRRIRPRLASLVRGGALGVGVALASLALHASAQEPGPAVDAGELRRHMDAFLLYWDAHRADLALLEWNGAMVAIGVALAGLLARDAARTEPDGVALRILLRVYVACAALGVTFALTARHAPPGSVPHALLAAMPTRLLNFPMVTFIPLLVAALARRRENAVARTAFLALGAVSLLWYRALWLVVWGLPAIAAVAAVLLVRGGSGPRAAEAPAWRTAERVAGLAVAVGTALTLAVATEGFPRRRAKLRDYSNDAALAAAARGAGALVVAPRVQLAQLATRRPLLLDPNAIDMLPYAPAGGPEVARIVGEVYGIDFFAPPPKAQHRSVVEGEVVRPIWEARSAADWSALGARFGFRDVLSPAGWKLALPAVADSPGLTLYRVPATEGPPGSQ